MAPPYDGGCPITGYILEKIEKDGDRFERCVPNLVPGFSYTVTGLTEGKEYQFRVRAENIAGPSDPSRSTPLIKAADPVGMLKNKIYYSSSLIMQTFLCVKSSIKYHFLKSLLYFLLQKNQRYHFMPVLHLASVSKRERRFDWMLTYLDLPTQLLHGSEMMRMSGSHQLRRNQKL